MVVWPNASGFFGNGMIEVTKNISHEESPAFISKILEMVRFPCIVRIDAHGFIMQKDNTIGFQFASPSSSMLLSNGKFHALMDGEKTVRPLLNFFSEMDGQEFLSRWYDAHDRVAELTSSGFRPVNTKSLVLYLEPVHEKADTIFGMTK